MNIGNKTVFKNSNPTDDCQGRNQFNKSFIIKSIKPYIYK